MPTLSITINADSRRGYLTNEKSSIGDYAPGGQEGCRSIDFFLEGVKNKMNFFKEYNCQCLLYLDEHEPIPDGLFMQIVELVKSYGNNSQVICKSHNRTRHRWYDYIYIEALKLAEGDYVVHFDCDTAAFKSYGSDIVEKYIKWLDEGYKYICYPIRNDETQMWWASTRFFICKRETLRLEDAEDCLNNDYLYKTYGRMRYDPYPCCWEHTAALREPEGAVLYPPRTDKEYIIFCWVTYFKGTLKKLNDCNYEKIQEFIEDKIYGANDLVDTGELL